MLPMNESSSTDKLKDWDFWGPLIFCLFLGLILSLGRNDSKGGKIFILIFAIVWIGGFIISINSQFLGAKLTVYQSICILGYCMFAIVLSALINLFLIFIPSVFKLGIGLCGCAYSIYGKIFFLLFSFLASYSFVIKVIDNQEKKWLVVYPICLFYLFLTWFTLAK